MRSNYVVWADFGGVKNARMATVFGKKFLSMLTGHTQLPQNAFHCIMAMVGGDFDGPGTSKQHCTAVANVTNMYNL